MRQQRHRGWAGPGLPSAGETGRSSGFDLVFAVAVVLFAVLGVLGGIDAKLLRVSYAKPDRPSNILEQTVDRLSTKTFDEVASMQGDVRKVASAATGNRFRVDLAVNQEGLGLLQIEAVLVDRRLGRQVDRLVTYRSRSRSAPR